MSKSLPEIAQDLKGANKKIQLIYAFNGSGKTRLSRAFKDLIAPKGEDDQESKSRDKILYYNAYTEDLFYWNNDLENEEHKLKITPNSFTDWILRERGDTDIIKHFQRYTNNKLSPLFHEKDIIQSGKKTGKKTYPEVTFSFETGGESSGSIKLSKGEESNFIWSIFYTVMEEVKSVLEQPDPSKRENNEFDQLEYVFIDDPVSSLDENHLVELAVNLAGLIKSSRYTDGQGLKFIITTHNPLFYNVLFNELNNKLYKKQPDGSRKCIYKPKQSEKYLLDKKEDGTYSIEQSNDRPFSYHLFLLAELKEAIKTSQIRKYHFSFLRNILEKTATFLGCKSWPDLLPKVDGQPDPFANRILNLSSHSAHSGEETKLIKDDDKTKLEELVNHLTNTYGFAQGEQNG